jgi:hypothetical protein
VYAPKPDATRIKNVTEARPENNPFAAFARFHSAYATAPLHLAGSTADPQTAIFRRFVPALSRFDRDGAWLPLVEQYFGKINPAIPFNAIVHLRALVQTQLLQGLLRFVFF